MKCINIYKIIPDFYPLFKEEDTSIVIELKNGQIAKIFNKEWLDKCRRKYSSLEKRIMFSEKLNLDLDIVKPEVLIYVQVFSDKKIIGYIMNKAIGVSLDEYIFSEKMIKKFDLHKYNQIHSNLTKIIKKYPNLVFPDLCSEHNIYINPEDLSLQLIDYDGIQIKEYASGVISNFVNKDKFQWENSKYLSESSTFCYTKELDIRSLVLLYFFYVFNIDLFVTQSYKTVNDDIIPVKLSLDELFHLIELKNDDIKHKVWLIFQNSKNLKNEYFDEESLMEIEEQYVLENFECEYGNKIDGKKGFCRRLVPKNKKQ